jgi:acyl homoserine lactone synthase
MLQLIAPDFYCEFGDELAEMHRLRFRVFKQRLDWEVQAAGDLEVDEFDSFMPTYLLQRHTDGRIQGCVRLLPTTGPTMLRDRFPMLLDGHAVPSSPAIWESSRFALDLSHQASRHAGSVAPGTYELFAGVLEFGLAHHLTDIVTVTDVRIERILRRASWLLRRIGQPRQIGSTLSVAGYLEVSLETLAAVRKAAGLRGPVLWMPVAPASWNHGERHCQQSPSWRNSPDSQS